MSSTTPETDELDRSLNGTSLRYAMDQFRQHSRKLEVERNNQKEIACQMQAERDEERRSAERIAVGYNLIERERDQLKNQISSCRQDLLVTKNELKSACQSSVTSSVNFRKSEVNRIEVERRYDLLKAVCEQLVKHDSCCHGPGEDPHCGRCNAIKTYNQLENDKP